MANVRAYILDSRLRPVPPGVPGELHIGGAGLARGYLNRPALTAERFIRSPFVSPEGPEPPGSRLYKTGDLARYLPPEDGLSQPCIEFLGRKDRQVKIRGFRVELEEIEAVLSRHPAVAESAATLHHFSDTDARLAAYAVPSPGSDPKALPRALRDFIKTRLPDYMTPSSFTVLEALPRTPAGKIDRKALPAPASNENSRQEDASPGLKTPTEEIVAGIWADVLGVEQVGARDNFFQRGGHSLLATRVVSRIRDVLSKEVSLRLLFDTEHLAAFCQMLDRSGAQAPPPLGGRGSRVDLRHAETRKPSFRRNPGFRLENCRNDGVDSGLKIVGITESPLAPSPSPLTPAPCPLSFSQERMWFLDRLEERNPAYNMPAALRLKGPLDAEALEGSLASIVERHETLRTLFVLADGVPRQRILSPEEALSRLAFHAFLDFSRDARPLERAMEEMTADSMRPFHLETGPLLRTRLMRLGDDDHVLYINTHHIVSDGWSIGVFVRELSEMYAARVQGRPSSLPELPVQYADFALWQRDWMAGDVLKEQLRWWKDHLEGAPPLLELPTDRTRPAVQSYKGATRHFEVPPEVTEALKALGRKEGATLFMVLEAAFALLLSRYSGQDDLVIGTPVANRNHTETEPLIGFFLNALALRTDLSGDPAFTELLRRVRKTTLSAYEHRDVPFEYLVEALRPERSLNHSPIFQTMLIYQNIPIETFELPGIEAVPLALEHNVAKIDTTLTMGEKDGGLTGSWEYNTDLFDDPTVDRMIAHFAHILKEIGENPRRRLSEVPLMDPKERHRVLAEWNDTAREYPGDRTVVDLLREQAGKRPGAVAVACEDQRMTYGELDDVSDRLAARLRSRGTGHETVVALCGDRTPEMLVGFLAILKAGGVYVPLDPSYPEDRLDFILEDSGAEQLLVADKYRDRFPSFQSGDPRSILSLDHVHALPQSPQGKDPKAGAPPWPGSLAYVIYTSGSTGKPKGAMVEHRGMLNHLYAKIYDLELSEKDRVVQNASQCFDISIWQFLAGLLPGGSVHIVGDQVARDPVRLFQTASREEVTVLEVVPSVLAVFLGELESGRQPRPDLEKLRWLVATGEALQPELCREWLRHYPDIPVMNAYGPTECSDDVTHYVLKQPPGPHVVHMPVGKPVINTRMYVLDKGLEPVPPGVVGELYVGGDGVGRGYLGRPGLTADRFLPDPFSRRPGARLYRTGDLGRHLPGGDIEFLGRVDHQVKIRGFRIELGEIESVLRTGPGVRESVVTTREDRPGVQALVAYVVLEDGPRSLEALRRHVKAGLPEHMVPSAIVPLEAMPLTPNGKIDRGALPAPEASSSGGRWIARDRTELELLRIWEEVLGVRPVGIQDNFFELGGHSLLAVRLMSHVQQRFGKQLPLSALFHGPTVVELASLLREDDNAPHSPLVPIHPGGSLPPLFILPGTGGNVLYYYQLAACLGPERPVYGLEPPGLDGRSQPLTSVEELAAHHVKWIKTVRPRGPYHLCGHSFGGFVAFEMARRLLEEGEETGFLAVFDTPAPGGKDRQPPEALFAGWEEADWLATIASIIGDLLGKDLEVTADDLRRLSSSDQLLHLNAKLQEAGWLVPGADPAQLRALVEVYKANARMEYRPEGPIPREIVLFHAEETPREPSEGEDRGWGRFSRGRVKVHRVPGSHLTMMLEPSVKTLAEKLSRELESMDGK